jgi:hypothetical protein
MKDTLRFRCSQHFLSLALILVGISAAIPASADVVYSTMPTPIPPNVPSLGYQATQTAEFGQGVDLSSSGGATLGSAQVLMSNWALESTYEPVGTSAGFTVPLTLNLYNVGPGDSVGSLISSTTIDALINWRPEASSGCTGGAYMASDGNCYNGQDQVVTFNLANVAVPQQFIYGLAFNTQTWGANPTGTTGPYNSLNFGLLGDGTNPVTPFVGTDISPNSAYWNTSTAGYYGDGGAGGTDTFRLDANNWQGYDPAVTFFSSSAVPEPRNVGLFAGLIVFAGLYFTRRIRRASIQ